MDCAIKKIQIIPITLNQRNKCGIFNAQCSKETQENIEIQVKRQMKEKIIQN